MPGKVVSVNGEPLVEPYAHFQEEDDVERMDSRPQSVPPHHLYVLGDNRDNSRDSRFWGFLPIDDVIGQATVVYLSWDNREGRGQVIRWDRIGHRLR